MNGTSGHIRGDGEIRDLSGLFKSEIQQSFRQARMWMMTCFASFWAGAICTLLIVWAAK